jgi:hypothetical protein
MNKQLALTAMILSVIPIPPVFTVSPFLLDGIDSVLGWVEVAILVVLLFMFIFAPANWWVGLIEKLLLLALLACYIAGMVFAIPNYLQYTEQPESEFIPPGEV